MLKQRKVIGVIRQAGDGFIQPTQEPHVERPGIDLDGLESGRPDPAQPEDKAHRLDDGRCDLVVVEPARKKGRLIDDVGKIDIERAAVEVLAPHPDHHVELRIFSAISEGLDDQIDELTRFRIFPVLIPEDLLELVTDNQEIGVLPALRRLALLQLEVVAIAIQKAGDAVGLQQRLLDFGDDILERLARLGLDQLGERARQAFQRPVQG